MAWWMWMLFGLAFLGAEMAVAGSLFALFFGLSALVVGVLVALGASDPLWLQWVLFAGLSVVALAVLRKPLKGRLNVEGKEQAIDTLVGESAIVTVDVPADGVGKVELRGSSWSARTAHQAPLARGVRTRVERVDGLTVWVRSE